MKLLIPIISTIVCLSITPSVQAKSISYFNAPISWAGTGCQAGSKKPSNGNTIKIALDDYEAGKNAQNSLNRAGCSFSIPITVPKGYKISTLTVDWQGYIKGKGKMSRKYFLAGRPYAAWKRTSYNKANGDDFILKDKINSNAFKTDCKGGRYNLRVNTDISVINDESYISLKSVDSSNSMKLSLTITPCR